MTLTATARCQRCPWQPDGTDPAAVDKQAAAHHRKTRHPVANVTEPAKRKGER